LPASPIRCLDDLSQALGRAKNFRLKMKRPFVIVSYAQSLDGSIAFKTRKPINLSGPAAMLLTHQIRALSDAILIGIETVLCDNPRLTVRLVNGPNPQPVILDTHLRMPLDAELTRRSDRQAWIASSRHHQAVRREEMNQAGARVLSCEVAADGRIDLNHLMPILAESGINSLMVEGGARVITGFINSRLVDLFIVTISPQVVGGLPVIDSGGIRNGFRLMLENVHYQPLENDLILWARPAWT
jgi:3,4-dihydroxy 2-butanone 4-phosphate synthase/GTP cyclohydrolase II